MPKTNVQLSILPLPVPQPPCPGEQAGPSLVVGGGVRTAGPQRVSMWFDGFGLCGDPEGGQGWGSFCALGRNSSQEGRVNGKFSVFIFKGM